MLTKQLIAVASGKQRAMIVGAQIASMRTMDTNRNAVEKRKFRRRVIVLTSSSRIVRRNKVYLDKRK